MLQTQLAAAAASHAAAPATAQPKITAQEIMDALGTAQKEIGLLTMQVNTLIGSQNLLADELKTLTTIIADLTQRDATHTAESPFVWWRKMNSRGQLVESCYTVRAADVGTLSRLIGAVDSLQPAEPATAPTAANGNGNAPHDEPDPSWCPIHDCQMSQHTSGTDTWYSHKDNGAWCRGTTPKPRSKPRM
jgi:hypothetical protein